MTAQIFNWWRWQHWSVLRRVNMCSVLVGYTLFTVSWVPPLDIFHATVLCNTIQFIDNWFWDIFHLSLPSGKQASGLTTTETASRHEWWSWETLSLPDSFERFSFSPTSTPHLLTKRCDLINFTICSNERCNSFTGFWFKSSPDVILAKIKPQSI